jgi:hypothetical protein
MKHALEPRLPQDVVTVLQLFTGEIKERNGKYMNQIPKDDARYKLLKRRPKIILLSNTHFDERKNSYGFTWFKTKDRTKHITISVYYNSWLEIPGLVREFHILGKDSVLTYV